MTFLNSLELVKSREAHKIFGEHHSFCQSLPICTHGYTLPYSSYRAPLIPFQMRNSQVLYVIAILANILVPREVENSLYINFECSFL